MATKAIKTRRDTLARYLKLTTAIPPEFIDDFHKICGNRDTFVKLDILAKWLNASENSLLRTLRNSYDDDSYTIESNRVSSNGGNNKQVVKLSVITAKSMIMCSRAKNAVQTRAYYIALEENLERYHPYIIDGIAARFPEISNLLRESSGVANNHATNQGLIYVFAAPDNHRFLKIGYTTALKQRLATYNTGLADGVILLYVYICDNPRQVEECIHRNLDAYRYKKRKEMFNVPLREAKRVIALCNSVVQLIHKSDVPEKIQDEFQKDYGKKNKTLSNDEKVYLLVPDMITDADDMHVALIANENKVERDLPNGAPRPSRR